jgi:hypothetical protein
MYKPYNLMPVLDYPAGKDPNHSLVEAGCVPIIVRNIVVSALYICFLHSGRRAVFV